MNGPDRAPALLLLVYCAIACVVPARVKADQSRSGRDCPAALDVAFVPVSGGATLLGQSDSAPKDEKPVRAVQLKSYCFSTHQLTDANIRALIASVGDVEISPDLSSQSGLRLALAEALNEPAEDYDTPLSETIAEFQEAKRIPKTGTLNDRTRAALLEATGTKLSRLRMSDGVTWVQALALARLYGKAAGRNVRLPSEPEWEHAARGGLMGKTSPWGNNNAIVGGRKVSEIISSRASQWCSNDQSQRSEAPRTLPPQPLNNFGVADLLSRWEWTSTLYAKYPYSATDGRESLYIGRGPRVIRGNGGGQETCKISVSFRGYSDEAGQFAVRLVEDVPAQ